jgi:hypothetical protein
MNPKEMKIFSKAWWVKPIEMLVHNWALIEENSKNKFTIYFFHDRGTTKGGGEHPNPFKHLRQESGYIAIIDSLQFDSKSACETALRRNDFELLSKLPGPWVGEQPEGIFFDARKYEKGIYSNAGYWKA